MFYKLSDKMKVALATSFFTSITAMLLDKLGVIPENVAGTIASIAAGIMFSILFAPMTVRFFDYNLCNMFGREVWGIYVKSKATKHLNSEGEPCNSFLFIYLDKMSLPKLIWCDSYDYDTLPDNSFARIKIHKCVGIVLGRTVTTSPKRLSKLHASVLQEAKRTYNRRKV